MTEIETNKPSPEKTIGRNEPCPCGSGKKYKRCHGVAAAPKLTPPAQPAGPTGGAPSGFPGMPAGFDPSSLDPQAMMPLIQAMQRLPRGQLQRLQAIMQKAMAGKDVSREAAELERSLPLEFQELVRGFKLPGMEGLAAPGPEGAAAAAADAAPAGQGEMTAEQARQIVEQAAAEGKISKDQAETLLSAPAGQTVAEAEKKGLGRFFKKLGGKS